MICFSHFFGLLVREGRCHEVAVVTNPPQPVYLSPQHKLLGGLLLFVKQCSWTTSTLYLILWNWFLLVLWLRSTPSHTWEPKITKPLRQLGIAEVNQRCALQGGAGGGYFSVLFHRFGIFWNLLVADVHWKEGQSGNSYGGLQPDCRAQIFWYLFILLFWVLFGPVAQVV